MTPTPYPFQAGARLVSRAPTPVEQGLAGDAIILRPYRRTWPEKN
jgi:hypothetical protein